MTASGRIQGLIYALICIGLWALIPVVAKTGQRGLDQHQFLFWSSLVSVLTLLLTACLASSKDALYALTPKRVLGLVALGLLGTYFYYLFLYLGYRQAVGLEVLVVQYSWPILIVLLSVPLLSEPLTKRKLVAVALGFIGVVVVLTKGDVQAVTLSNLEVILLVLLGALCFALFSVLDKKMGTASGIDSYLAVTVYFLAALAASGLSMLWFSEFAVPSVNGLWPIVLNGVLVNGLSYVFWMKALRATEASFLATLVFLTPVLSALYLILFFNEPALPIYGLGLGLVILAGWVTVSTDKESVS